MYFILFATTMWLRVKLLRYNGSILIVNYLFNKFCSTCMQRIVRASSCLDAIPYSGKLSREKTFVVLWLFANFSMKFGGKASFGGIFSHERFPHSSVAEHWLHKPVSWFNSWWLQPFQFPLLLAQNNSTILSINESCDHDGAIRFIPCLHFS